MNRLRKAVPSVARRLGMAISVISIASAAVLLTGCVEEYGEFGAGSGDQPPPLIALDPPARTRSEQPQSAASDDTVADARGVSASEPVHGSVGVASALGTGRMDGPTPVKVVTAVPTLVTTPLPTMPANPTVPPTPTADPFKVVGAPTRLQIPAIGVDAYVERVGLTVDRAMDVPKQWMNVGWYQEGFYPGEAGNAVIAGHLDSTGGGPAVFWDLDNLAPGDEVTVTYESGDSYTFVVQGQQIYPYDTKDQHTIESIFGSSITSDLNLITCNGAWDRGQRTYSERLVVFTTLLPEKTVRASGADLLD